jgi:hypothetical protein
MLLCNDGSFQAHWLDGRRSISVAGSARGRNLGIAAANKRSVADCEKTYQISNGRFCEWFRMTADRDDAACTGPSSESLQ